MIWNMTGAVRNWFYIGGLAHDPTHMHLSSVSPFDKHFASFNTSTFLSVEQSFWHPSGVHFGKSRESKHTSCDMTHCTLKSNIVENIKATKAFVIFLYFILFSQVPH